MKKVLILSYYFPPCNLTAAQRIGSWEKYLPEFGFYPIVVTRHWTGNELSEIERLSPNTQPVKIEKHEKSEVHSLPYKKNWRDYFFIKGQNTKLFLLLSKTVTLFNVFFQNFTIKAIRFNNLCDYADKLIRAQHIEYVIISVDPFEQFFFGYLLKKKYPNLKWIADYRDDWTTSDIDKFTFRKLQSLSEKKWVSTASLVTSVSPYYTDKIASFTNVPGLTIYNGFKEMEVTKKPLPKSQFHITYNGTLYPSQPIDIFLEGLKMAIDKIDKISFHISFPGLLFKPAEAKRVIQLMKGYETYITITDRVKKEEVLMLQQNSDILLMVAHKGIKGIPSSKVFEYIGLAKPFIVCPGDEDVLDQIARESKLGVILNDSLSVYKYLLKEVEKKQTDIDTATTSNHEARALFSVKHQVKQLAEALKNLN